MLRDAGMRIAIAGNQPRETEAALAAIGIPFDLVATSERYGAPKPEPAFFEQLLAEIGEPPDTVAYVGDRIDNDVLPAHAAGMRPVFLRRGPWARIQVPSVCGESGTRISPSSSPSSEGGGFTRS